MIITKNRTCSIEGCGRHHNAKGWCSAHYTRWRRYGDPFGGKTPVGRVANKGAPLEYLEGVVLPYGGDECLIWPYGKVGGYGKIQIDGKTRRVHRVVCERVHGRAPSPKHEAAHSCGNGHLGCCNRRHLRWATHAENMADKVEHGTSNRGERHGLAKLTDEQVTKIRSLRGELSQRKIAAIFGVAQSSVSQIHGGKNWIHLMGASS